MSKRFLTILAIVTAAALVSPPRFFPREAPAKVAVTVDPSQAAGGRQQVTASGRAVDVRHDGTGTVRLELLPDERAVRLAQQQ